ncbi:MAG: phosphate signaling complex protein PhoU [Anaerolineaceae bacterium]|nr:phosphate signaling complex protein PhoU [Anaerolineaceae bacterium]
MTFPKVYRNDHAINEKRFDIENNTLTLIATQQPMASDLRVLSSIIEVITELERIGDYAKGVARINFLIGHETLIIPIGDLLMMAELASDMMLKGIKAFVEQHEDLARSLPSEDDKVDELYNQFNKGLVARMVEDNSLIKQANLIQWAFHNIERMADRVTNICERTIFVVTGEMNEYESLDKVLFLQ